jgi:Na+/melibiose symporter-like transporter
MLMLMKVAWRLLWLGVLGGAVVGFIAAFLVTFIAQALGLVPANQSPPGTYLLWVVLGIVWFLAVLITTNRRIPRD